MSSITVSQYTASIMILEYYGTASLETSSDETTCIITTHGLNTGDFIVNTTRRAPTYTSAERGSRKVISVTGANTFTVEAIASQSQNDDMLLFKYIDRTDYVLDGTINITLRAEGQNESSFMVNRTNMDNDSISKITPGQYVKIELNNDLKFAGLVDNTDRSKDQTVIKQNINCVGFNNIPSRRTIELNYSSDVTSSVVIDDMIEYLMQDGIESGAISTGIVFEDEWKNEVISISDVLDECSNRNGFQWFIDQDMKLQFYQDLTTISYCTNTIETGGTFKDYRNVVIKESIDNYVNKVFVIGGNDDHGDTIWVNNADLDEQNAMQLRCGGTGVYGNIISDGAIVGHDYITIGASSPTYFTWTTNSLEIGDWFWNITQDSKGYITATGSTTVACTTISNQTIGDEIEVYNEANGVGRNTLKKQSIVPETIEFKSYNINFLPQTKLTVSISDLSCSGVYNIEEVNIIERQACYFETTVKATKKITTNFSTQKILIS
jgi:hypothetical protein